MPIQINPSGIRPEPNNLLVPDEFHVFSDVNLDANALHHTLGTRAHEAAAGNHKHDGVYAPVGTLLVGAFAKQSMNSGTQAVLRTTYTTILMTDVRRTDLNITYNSGNGKFTVKQDGFYLIQASVQWASNSVNKRALAITNKDGLIVAESRIQAPTTVSDGTNFVSTVVNSNVGDTYIIQAWQNSDAASPPGLNVVGSYEGTWSLVAKIDGPQGPAGKDGKDGLDGQDGSSGTGSGSVTYREYTFATPVVDWTIAHNLNLPFVEINCYDSAVRVEYEVEIEHVNNNTSIVHWASPMSGVARLIVSG